MWFALWYISGICGAYLVWWFWVLEFEDYRTLTPRAVIGIVFAGLLGPVAVIFGIEMTLAYWGPRSAKFGRFSSWLGKPFGRKE